MIAITINFTNCSLNTLDIKNIPRKIRIENYACVKNDSVKTCFCWQYL